MTRTRSSSHPATVTKNLRTQPKRRYHEISSEDDDSEEVYTQSESSDNGHSQKRSRVSRQPARRNLSTRAAITVVYDDTTTSSEGNTSADDSSGYDNGSRKLRSTRNPVQRSDKLPARKRIRPPPRHSQAANTLWDRTPQKKQKLVVRQTGRVSQPNSPDNKRKPAGAKVNSPQKGVSHEESVIACKKSPPWQELPWFILESIFTFAAYPLQGDDLHPTSGMKWLIGVAGLCKAFSEPALRALHRFPPVFPLGRAVEFLQHLQSFADHTHIPYKETVRRLDIDVENLLFYSGQGKLNLAHLIESTPNLQELEICHTSDRPPYRHDGLSKKFRWVYQDEVFDILDKGGIRLKKWRWNARMHKDGACDMLATIHLRDAFKTLEEVSFYNYSIPDAPPSLKNQAIDDPPTIAVSTAEYIAASLSSLSSLRSLRFETCEVVDEDLLPLLPENLISVSFINCPNLTSDALQLFLFTHGRFLTELILNHNQSLNLSFLTDLAASCPQLQTLKMDLLYYNTHSTFKDSDPEFEWLLAPGEVPTWPSSLIDLELLQLRKWETESAESFFASLINSASELPNLRKLILTASLNMEWRVRATFRDSWVRRLERCFRRRAEPPNPYLRSFEVWEAHKAELAGGEDLCVKRQLPEESDEDIIVWQPKRSGSSERTQAWDTDRESCSMLQKSKGKLVRGKSNALPWEENVKFMVFIPTQPVDVDSESDEEPLLQMVQRNRREPRPSMLKRELDLLASCAGKDRPGDSSEEPRRPNGATTIERELEDLSRSAGYDRPRRSVVERINYSDTKRLDYSRSDSKGVKRKTRAGRTEKLHQTKYSGACSDSTSEDEDAFRQGLCDTVKVEIGNLRPREKQFREADFLDSEPESDDDWDGVDKSGDERIAF
ncbi:MAG: hypothetical protein M1824_001677 [Vezdaea acicularis]|nr:MAG: hypothetical protein M1824_001677 [Vezdaea acicularis]